MQHAGGEKTFTCTQDFGEETLKEEARWKRRWEDNIKTGLEKIG
jgi:hypothetical protein